MDWHIVAPVTHCVSWPMAQLVGAMCIGTGGSPSAVPLEVECAHLVLEQVVWAWPVCWIRPFRACPGLDCRPCGGPKDIGSGCL